MEIEKNKLPIEKKFSHFLRAHFDLNDGHYMH